MEFVYGNRTTPLLGVMVRQRKDAILKRLLADERVDLDCLLMDLGLLLFSVVNDEDCEMLEILLQNDRLNLNGIHMC
jgi:hypothetical protein